MKASRTLRVGNCEDVLEAEGEPGDVRELLFWDPPEAAPPPVPDELVRELEAAVEACEKDSLGPFPHKSVLLGGETWKRLLDAASKVREAREKGAQG